MGGPGSGSKPKYHDKEHVAKREQASAHYFREGEDEDAFKACAKDIVATYFLNYYQPERQKQEIRKLLKKHGIHILPEVKIRPSIDKEFNKMVNRLALKLHQQSRIELPSLKSLFT